jgi:hypothetical protein
MEPRYKLLENLPLSVWLYLKDFLQPTDLENILVTGSHLWKHIFKDTKWLEFAQTFDQCSPFLLGYELSKFRHNRTSNNLYLVLVALITLGNFDTFEKNFLLPFRRVGCSITNVRGPIPIWPHSECRGGPYRV